MKPLPAEIAAEVVRQQTKMGCPEWVPAFAEVPDARGKIYFVPHDHLSAGMCEQVVESGIGHVTAIARLPRVVLAEEEAVGLEERCERPEHHRIEFTEPAGGLIRAVLLLVQRSSDAHRLEVLEKELHGVDEHGRP